MASVLHEAQDAQKIARQPDPFQGQDHARLLIALEWGIWLARLMRAYTRAFRN